MHGERVWPFFFFLDLDFLLSKIAVLEKVCCALNTLGF